MNEHLQNILNVIQQDENLTTEQKNAIAGSLKNADKELEITAFKLDRTEKVKRTTAILLEETIAELEQKRKAVEEQNRELEIEASLERVRSRAMAMQNSEELRALIGTVFTELTKLDLVLTRCVIWIFDMETSGARWWMANGEDPTNPMSFYVQNHEAEPYQAFLNAWRQKQAKFVYDLKSQIKKDWDDFLFKKTELSNLPQFVIDGMKAPDRVLLSASFNRYSAINVASLEPISGEHFEILLRFAKVFEGTYTRFNDLQKAEAQAREAHIEASLERVRSRTMAMQKSDELQDVALLLFKQVQALGVPSFACGFNIWDDDRKAATAWMAREDALQPPFKTSSSEDVFLHIHEAAQRGEPLFVAEQGGEELKTHYRYMASIPVFRDVMEKMAQAGLSVPTFQIIHCAFFSQGYLMFISFDPAPGAHDIFIRFAKVFEQTYTRFLDLKKAEAQVREARIEAALEKVRSATMSMHESNELRSVIQILKEQLLQLNFNFHGVNFVTEIGEHRYDMWLASPEYDFPVKLSIPKLDYEGSRRLNDAKNRGIDFFSYTLDKEQKDIYFKNFFGNSAAGQIPEEKKQIAYSASGLAASVAIFKKVVLTIHNFDVVPYTEEENAVFLRFATVFQQSYTRFLDLQIAEEQAREALTQASLDRVRAEVASMRNADDLQRITPIIWKELNAMKVPFSRCGIFIIEEANQMIRFYLSSPDGRPLTTLQLDINSSETIISMVNSWRQQEVFAIEWTNDQFQQWVQSIIDLGKIKSASEYQAELALGYIYLHFIPFKQGMFYIGTSDPLSTSHIGLVKKLAAAFSIAYSRYEDFKKLEFAKTEVEKTLDDLKSTQAQLIQSEKMASLGELTAGIAHEIQNPLNFVNNFSEVNKELLEELKEEIDKGNLEDVKSLANDIIDNEQKINHHGKRADAIVKGMLQHSRSSNGLKEPTDINKLADEYLRLAYHGLRAKDNSFNATIKTDFDESIGNINIIPQDIGRVILNLITNAFYVVGEKKKTPQPPKGGVAYEPIVTVSTKKTNDKVEIRVADNGNGIPQKVLDKIFQPFFTTKPTGQGTGLGLSLSYDIVKAHGGELKVETNEGKGTEFIIQLPTNS